MAKCQWNRTGWCPSTFITRDLARRAAKPTHYLYQHQRTCILTERFPLVDSSQVPWLRAVLVIAFLLEESREAVGPQTASNRKTVCPLGFLSLLRKPLGLHHGFHPDDCLILIRSPRPHLQTTQIKFLLSCNLSLRIRSILMNLKEHTPHLNAPPWSPMTHFLLIKIIYLPKSQSLTCSRIQLSNVSSETQGNFLAVINLEC